MISLRASAQGNFHANTILPPLGHRREQFEVGNKISVPSRKSYNRKLSSVCCSPFIYLFIYFSLSRDQRKEGEKSWINHRFQTKIVNSFHQPPSDISSLREERTRKLKVKTKKKKKLSSSYRASTPREKENCLDIAPLLHRLRGSPTRKNINVSIDIVLETLIWFALENFPNYPKSTQLFRG